MMNKIYSGITSIPYTKITSIHYQTLSKKDTTWKIDVNNLSVRSLQGLFLIFLDKGVDFTNKNEEFLSPAIKKFFIKINGLPYQLFAVGIQQRDIYTEVRKYFYKENSDATWEEFLTSKFALWFDTCSATNNDFHGSGRAVVTPRVVTPRVLS